MPNAMANRLENAKSADKGAAKEAAPAAAAAAAPAAESGGIKPFIPLLANLILMPVLAYAMTAFVLVPKLAKKAGHTDPSAETAAPAHGEESSSAGKRKSRRMTQSCATPRRARSPAKPSLTWRSPAFAIWCAAS